MADPNFETPSKPGGTVFGPVNSNPPGANKKLEAGIGEQLGQAPGSPKNVDLTNLREFVDKDYMVIDYDLTNARSNELVDFPRRFSFVFVPNSTNDTDVMQIKFGSQGADAVPFLPGGKINGIPFDRLFISNEAIVGATMTIMFAENWPTDMIGTDQ